MSNQGTVLVTGGSGFIGSWWVITALQQGYTVRTTVQNLAREGAVRTAIGKVINPQDRLSFYAADLMSDTGWDAATGGCDYVRHVASPWAWPNPRMRMSSSFRHAKVRSAQSRRRSRPA
jgi:dihydroflavonol-4-reductase